MKVTADDISQAMLSLREEEEETRADPITISKTEEFLASCSMLSAAFSTSDLMERLMLVGAVWQTALEIGIVIGHRKALEEMLNGKES